MRPSILPKLLVGIVSMSVVSGLASISSASAGVGTWDDYSEANFESMAFTTCGGAGASPGNRAWPTIDDIQYGRSGDLAEVVIVSATVDRDGAAGEGGAYDATCTFAVVATQDAPGAKYASNLAGSFRLTVESPVDDPATTTGTFSQVYSATTTPVFTDVDEYATASLEASGQVVSLRDGMVTTPGTPATADKVAWSKRIRDGRIKKAQAQYAKAKKKTARIDNARQRSKAKKKALAIYKRDVRRAKETYAMRVAPTPARTAPGSVPTQTPFSLRVVL
ncbi:hypothetical protein [Aeromicrobium endophyticum]|uniref:Uncharacterized protein n=1 Tax=Aeromicrobium endophyticum TaxID=2292704 RepID=A0A371PBU2_9ACTN|nr:hypothetical protein [Aeromicrobium endophyticum]REK73046.1 hypothetical protein DX116_05515 [Aeromicrobium endophyticum]